MRLIITCTLVAMFMANEIMAQETNDTLVVEKPDKVVLTSNNQSMTVDIFGKENDPDYHFSRTQEMNDGVNISKESNSDFDFKLPFSKSSYFTQRRLEFSICPTLSVGMVSALGGPSQLDTNFGESFEITWHACFVALFLNNSRWSYNTGLWLNWKNYRMTNNVRFDLVDGNVQMMHYPENADYNFSRIHLLSYQIPLLVNYRSKGGFKFAAGPLLSFNGHGNLKTKYSIDGKGYKDRDRGVHLNSFTADIIGIVSYKSKIGAYVKYSPFNVLDTKRGPKFHGLSVGLIWDF